MFAASLLFLLFTAGGLQVLRGGVIWPPDTTLYWWGMVGLYPLFVAELVAHGWAGSPRWKRGLVVLLVPPLRLVSRDHTTGTYVWMPRWGWQRVDRALRKRMEKAFSGPMILIALLVLPLLAVEYFSKQHVSNGFYLDLPIETGTSIIWLAFTIEFIVMVSIVNRPFRYCKQHWIDLAIILLPFIAFLRLFRLGALMRLQHMTRVFRLRGLAMRMFRAVLLLDIVGRIIKISPERRLRALDEMLAEKQEEMDEIRTEMRAIQRQLAADEESTA